MKKLKAFIVEDERHNRNMLINLLQDNFNDTIEIAGSADSVSESVEFLKIRQVDILFLDIELSDGQVFDLLNQIDFKKYRLIFTTGYSEYAIKAIKYAAVDYLLKPINTNELISAVNSMISGNFADYPILEDMVHRKQFGIAEYLVVNNSRAIEKIPFKDILYLKADGVYTMILHAGKKTISSKPIGIYEDILPEGQFIRCHKSYIVNKLFIKQISKGRGCDLTLLNGDELPVAVRKKDEFMHWYNLKD